METPDSLTSTVYHRDQSNKTQSINNDTRRLLEYLYQPGDVFEICLIGGPIRKHSLWGNEYASGRKPIIAGWFDDFEKAITIIDQVDKRAKPAGIYVTLNSCISALLGRANNRMKAGVNRTKDKEIASVNHLLVDADPVRPEGICATQKEKEAALTLLRTIYADLKKDGWPEPLVADSGNGGHLLYKIDVDVAPLIADVLKILDQQYSTETVKIDTTVGNPARLVKVYGTMTRKGDSTQDRPHRMARILSFPQDMDKRVTRKQVQKLADQFQGSEKNHQRTTSKHQGKKQQFDVFAYLEKYGIETTGTKRNGNSTLYILKHCVFDQSHSPKEAAIGQTDNGKLYYQCFHDSCQKKTWHDARQIISSDESLFDHKDYEQKASSSPTTVQQQLSIIRATEITPEPIDWLWQGYLAKGKLQIIAGPPGTGKTTIALSFSATITAGGKFPDAAKPQKGNVLIWSGEDDPQDTLLPRLLGMGGDPNRIFFVGEIQQGDELQSFDPSIHIKELANAIEEIGSLSLLVIDPIVNAVAGDSHKNTEVRRALQPVVDLAYKHSVAVIGISHFSKATAGRNPVERVTGSIAFGALARVVLAAVKIEDNDGDEKRLLTRAKSNIGPDGGGFFYSIGQKNLVDHPEIVASSISWLEPIEGDARALLAKAESVVSSEESGALAEAKSWLEGLLNDVGEMEKNEIMELAKENNFSTRTVHRAREKIGVLYRTEGFGKKKKSLWYLPNTNCANDGVQAQKEKVGTTDESLVSKGTQGYSLFNHANDTLSSNRGTNGKSKYFEGSI